MPDKQIRDLARYGAQARLAALDEEREALLKMFPEFRGGTPRGARRNGSAPAAPAAPRKRKRGGMSAEARKAQSERMTAYWAARRAEKAAGAQAGGNGTRKRGKAGRKRGRK